MDHPTNAKLREIMEQLELTPEEVSVLLHKSITPHGKAPTVRKWLATPTDAHNYRRMAESDLELLMIKTGELSLPAFHAQMAAVRRQLEQLRAGQTPATKSGTKGKAKRKAGQRAAAGKRLPI